MRQPFIQSIFKAKNVFKYHCWIHTEERTYHCSNIDFTGPTTEILRRIGLASTAMSRLTSVWRQNKLSFSTKLRLYNVFVVSVLLYGCETGTTMKADESCKWRIIATR